MEKVAVLGGGSWATALVKILSENKSEVHWWMRNQSDVQHLIEYRHNPRYLSQVSFDLEYVKPSTDIKAVVAASDWVILVVPAAFVQLALADLPPDAFKGKVMVSAIKGMIPKENILITDYMERHYHVPASHQLVVAGPCHAEEVALEKQSYLTIGSHNMQTAEVFCALLRNRYVKANPLDDLDGIEYCAVMKNVIALACGIARGLNYGDNFQAVLVSNAMFEIERFLDAIMPIHRDLSGSAYLGDLLVTAYSQFSRNRTFGNMIGRGYTVKSAQVEMNMVAEGYYAVQSIYELNKELKVDMPITQAVYMILYERISPAVEFSILQEKFI
ncbi:glycerol-3-phosphate dehydrogenase (NAD(P)+) [Pontibacter ummariensis]|uniref:Glycerol-3-phosphate dehydrogenase n=1 Tax=Pontibacter ummariensis TaxID=1610492 RepID=A0A239BRC6_9BACT|nr:NAD(P)H-dependent glycerol-3-phosphate dehydrogenase [Pontibacter ummariensis]PRY15655.1 glycerol-3-phosphate dehydrogenase (NAD(P)+) [Pontibacter ummariensis]SNS10625.1 glycerol-3-phosphate dehydrogenase (NAD(P)+) [Pontibacter ummariensis]